MEGTTLVLNDKQLKRVRILIDDYVNLRGNIRCQDRAEIEELNDHIKSVYEIKDNKKIVDKPVIYVQHQMLKAYRGLGRIKEYVKKTKRLTKNEINEHIKNINEPLLRAFMDVFPDEDNTDYGEL
jgi:hypothetical protein